MERHPAATKGWVGGKCWGSIRPGAESGGRRWRQDGTGLAEVVPAPSNITLHYPRNSICTRQHSRDRALGKPSGTPPSSSALCPASGAPPPTCSWAGEGGRSLGKAVQWGEGPLRCLGEPGRGSLVKFSGKRKPCPPPLFILCSLCVFSSYSPWSPVLSFEAQPQGLDQSESCRFGI